MNKTLCSNCAFLVDQDCKFNRFEHFKDKLLKIGKYLELQDSCNAFRNKENYTQNMAELIEQVKDEIYPKVDIIIQANHEENLKFWRMQKINKIILIFTKDNYKKLVDNVNETEIIVYADEPVASYINKLTGEYFLILDNYYEKDLSWLNDDLNVNMKKLVSTTSKPLLLQTSAFQYYYKKIYTFQETIDFLFETQKEHLRKWPE